MEPLHNMECVKEPDDNTHYCYILYNTQQPHRTYVGYTTNPLRRLRQHNGLISGGAKATTLIKEGKGCWAFLAIITSLSFNKNVALSFEWHLKYVCRSQKLRGTMAMKRIAALFHLVKINKRFKDFDFHIYLSQHAEHIFPDYLVEDLSKENVVMYDTMSDILEHLCKDNNSIVSTKNKA